jgi:glycosyltransferase involved in cell wall biosynthesis
MENKCILLIVRSLRLGGLERMTVNLANALNRQGHEVHILTYKNRIDLTPEDGVTIHTVDFEKIFRLTIVGALYDLLNRSLVRYLLPGSKKVMDSLYFSKLFKIWVRRQEKRQGRPFDLMIARGLGSFEGLAGLGDPRLVRVVVNELWGSPERMMDRIFYRRTFHGSTVFFNSRQVLESLESMCGPMSIEPRRCELVRNPTDIGKIRRDSTVPLDFDRPFIVNVGRQEHSKNQKLLLEAFAAVAERIPHALVFVGKGSLQKALMERTAALGLHERVVFAGEQQNPYPWMKRADLFVLTSLHEGSPNVVIESLVCGTPVVVTRGKGGAVELMQGELAGFVAEMEVDSLARKMLEALENPPSIPGDFVESFSMKTVARQYLEATP